MNCQMKDALNEFISNSSSAIEQAMKNGSHGKDEPVIQDLVNYLSCPTPQSCHEESQALLVNNRIPIHKPSFNPSSLETAHHAHINCEPQDSSHHQMCVSTCTSNCIVGTPAQHFNQQSFEQNTLYEDSLKHSSCTKNNFQDMHLVNSSTCDSSRNQESDGNQSSIKAGVGETQYFHGGQAAAFHCPSDVDSHHHHSLENQFSSTEKNPQANTSDFNNPSTLSSSYTPSSNSLVHYSSRQDSLGYDLMDVIQVSVDNLETSAHRLKAQEKMHVDEPELIFDQVNNATRSSQLEAVLAGFVEAHMQSYNSDGYITKSSMDNAQGSAVTSSYGILTAESTSHSNQNSEAVSTITMHDSSALDLSRSSYKKSPLSSSFICQSPPQPMSSPAESLSSDFPVQPSPCQGSSANSDPAHYISWQSRGFSVPTNSSTFQDNQYQDSPIHSHSPSNIPDSFKMSSTISQTKGLNQEQHHHQSFDFHLPHSSHQSPLLAHSQLQQGSLVVNSDYCSDAATVHSPDQCLGGYIGRESSSVGVSDSFSSSLQDDQQQSYLTSPVPHSSSELSDPSGLISLSSTTLTANTSTGDLTCPSKSITNYVDSSDHIQAMEESGKVSSDVTMRDLQSGDKATTFSQLVLNVTPASVSPQNTSGLNIVSDPSGYDGYRYTSMTSASTNFTQSTNTVADADAHFSFNQQPQLVASVGSYNPTLSIGSFVTGLCDENTVHQFGPSSFNLHPSSEIASESYPQPMLIQDSDFGNKIVVLGDEEKTSRSTETAMEITSCLTEKSETSSCISYEEIHMSIVKAGNVLSNNLHEANLHPCVLSDSSHALADANKVSDSFSGIHPGPVIGILQTEIPDIASSVSYNAGTKSALTEASETMARRNSFSSNEAGSNTLSNSDSVLTSISNVNANHNLISSILNNLQMPNVPSSQLLLQEQHSRQMDMTVPNFLENPDKLLASNHISNLDNMSFISTNITKGQVQAHSEVLMNTSPPATTTTTVSAVTIINQPILVDTNVTESQQSPRVSISPHVSTLLWPSEPSLLSQSEIGLVVNDLSTSQTKPVLSPQQAGTLMTDSVSSSEILLQLASPLSDSKNPTLLSAASDGVNSILQESKPGVITNPSSTSQQPHIFVSLEDLQKLLAQQNLTHSSASLHQQQSHVSSPQTLVLHKHASHSLRQSQPKLLIKGATLSSSPRVTHLHQTVQQTRDRLQSLVHQPSEHISTGTLFKGNIHHTVVCSTQEIQQKCPSLFQLSSVNIDQHQAQQKLQQHAQNIEHQPQPNLQLKQTQVLQQQEETANLFLQQQLSKSGEQKGTSLHIFGHQLQTQQQTNQIHSLNVLPQQQNQNGIGIQLAQMQQELQQLQKQQELQQLQKQQELQQLQKQQWKSQEKDEHQMTQFHNHHQAVEITDRKTNSESLKKDYKHLHSLLTGDITELSSHEAATQAKALPSALNFPCGHQGQASLHLMSGLSANVTSICPLFPATPTLTAPLSLLHVNNFSKLPQVSSNVTQPNAPLTTLAFIHNSTTCTLSKSFETIKCKSETVSTNSQPQLIPAQTLVTQEDNNSYKKEPEIEVDGHSNRYTSILAQILTERKRCHTPLSVDLNSPTNSSSEAGSPISSPAHFEDGSTQLTLIERSADLQIKSDSMHGLDDGDDENAIFDLNPFHKRPSACEFHTASEQNSNIPIKVAKPSINADAHSSVNTPVSPDPKFDFASAVTSTSNFLFTFGKKEDNSSEVYTFGKKEDNSSEVYTFGKKEDNSSEVYTFGTSASTCDSQQCKDGSKHYRPSSSLKSVTKAVGVRSVVPMQPVRPTSRKQKEYSLKAYYPSKVDDIELKIVEQPEPQHRARYQTEGSRGAIKDASLQGFPVIKLLGYSKTTKLQVFIGDECSRVKPHGFYQACRVFGKSSTSCTEQEIEGTTVVEIDMLPENDMTIKLDCIGILKLRNADVERRIGPKRARDKKRTNIRARLVMRCMVVKCDGSQHLLQVVSNPIVCTQPVGQPEICRMSLSESNVHGGESLFIIGKNFRNKGTSVLFQKLDSNDNSLLWQAEAEIEQEFFQPTHLICKIPPYKDRTIESPLVAQIVVSCAGKKSDPLSFVYKPVYPVAPSMKIEIPREADMAVSTRSVSFASPEDVNLNQMVQRSLTQSSVTSTSILQQAADTKPSTYMDPIPTKSDLSLNITSPLSASLTAHGQGQPTFLLEKKYDWPVQKLSRPTSETDHLPASTPNWAMVNCNVYSNSDTNSSCDSHAHPSFTSSHTNCKDTSSSVTKSTPFLVVVDPTALQSSVGGDKIQQLLLQILEAQSKSDCT